MTTATFKDMQLLITEQAGPAIYHQAHLCSGEELSAGRIRVKRADPLDFTAYDMVACDACDHQMALHWFLNDKYADWIAENYCAHGVKRCECGSLKIGIQPYRPGHSWWCPVAAP